MIARFRQRYARRSSWQLNMTPLIDVTFLLLTYFMLASHYATAEKPDMHLPRPDDSQASDRRLEDQIVINMLHVADAREPGLTFGPVPVGSVSELADRLNDLGRRNKQVQVVLRADRRVRYGEVRKVMEIVAAANLAHLQVVAELEQH